MAKFYFQKDDESCYDLQYHIDYMIEHGIQEMEVFEAVPEFGTGYFFCKHFSEVGLSGEETCGSHCEAYKPRNGKNGRCVHHGYVYEFGKSKLIRI